MAALLYTIHVPCSVHLTAAFNVSLELQGDCSDQLTLICRHDDILSDPNWIHNETAEGGELLATAFPGLTMYSFQNSTEHRVTVIGVGNLPAVNGYIQCIYSIRGTPIKSNAVKYSFVPNGQSQHVTTINYALHFCQQFIYCVSYSMLMSQTDINESIALYGLTTNISVDDPNYIKCEASYPRHL